MFWHALIVIGLRLWPENGPGHLGSQRSMHFIQLDQGASDCFQLFFAGQQSSIHGILDH
jgi:hypothetical protein